MRFQIIIAVLLLIVTLVIVNSVKKHKLDFRHGISWIVSVVFLLILDIFPGIIAWFASLCGVELPINMMFFFGIVLCYILIYGLSVTISILLEKVKKLTQEVALLEEKIDRLCK